MALRMRFVTSQCTVYTLQFDLFGRGTLDNMEGVVDCDHKIQHQFVIDVNILIRLSIIATTATPLHCSQLRY